MFWFSSSQFSFLWAKMLTPASTIVSSSAASCFTRNWRHRVTNISSSNPLSSLRIFFCVHTYFSTTNLLLLCFDFSLRGIFGATTGACDFSYKAKKKWNSAAFVPFVWQNSSRIKEKHSDALHKNWVDVAGEEVSWDLSFLKKFIKNEMKPLIKQFTKTKLMNIFPARNSQ